MRATVVKGKRAVDERLAGWLGELAPDLSFKVEETMDRGDRILVAAHHQGGAYTADPIAERFWYVWTVRDAKLRRIEIWPDRQAALRALEISR